jgi:uncharacterized protein YcbX
MSAISTSENNNDDEQEPSRIRSSLLTNEDTTTMKELSSRLLVHYLSMGKITGLYRHAVKGLSADELETVVLGNSESFPDDRRFALMKSSSSSTSMSNSDNKELFDPDNPEWLHKEKFLCAFSAPELMAKYRASYSMQVHTAEESHASPSDGVLATDNPTPTSSSTTTKLLTLYERSTDDQVLGPLDLSTEEGRQALAAFFSNQSDIPALTCVTAADGKKHQFGNTSSGWKQKQDTRTVHIINESTVQALSSAISGGGNGEVDFLLNPTRFRPNIVLKGEDLAPFSEWDWIGKTIQCGTTRLQVISKTVRCEGVSIDPLEYPENVLDIPKLMVKHFPEHGPYLGVYAVVEQGGEISLGDDVSLVK